jgi:hypothetical protein
MTATTTSTEAMNAAQAQAGTLIEPVPGVVTVPPADHHEPPGLGGQVPQRVAPGHTGRNSGSRA